jgi:DnaJ family protein A protein 2
VKPTVHKLKCSLEDIYNGKNTKIKVNRERLCIDCGGKGGEGVETCRDCSGRGMKTMMTMLGPGMYSQRTGPCDTCEG